jgi:hypothetical protein
MASKKPTKRTRDIQLLVRVDEEESEAFRAAAAEVGLDLTNWIRTVCRRASGLPTVHPRNPRHQFRRGPNRSA